MHFDGRLRERCCRAKLRTLKENFAILSCREHGTEKIHLLAKTSHQASCPAAEPGYDGQDQCSMVEDNPWIIQHERLASRPAVLSTQSSC